MRITYDPAKRDKTLSERALDFEDALLVLAGTTVEVVDDRKDYGEPRTRIISARKADAYERSSYQR